MRVVRASELSESISHTLSQTLIRWIVDLNFGTDVAAPFLTREFRIEESNITVPDLSLLIQSGYTPRKEWIERHFRVELEEKDGKEGEPEGDQTTYDPQEDQDLFGSIFGGQEGGQGGKEAAAADLQAAADETAMPAGADPEESQADATDVDPAAELSQVIDDTPEPGSQGPLEMSLEDLLSDEDEETKPFGNEKITEDEAVEMDK